MANFFTDNDDIQFLFNHLNLAEIAAVQEDGFNGAAGAGDEIAPRDAADAIDNYRRILNIVGDIAANHVAPRAEQIDHEGNTLNDDSTVTLNSLVKENLHVLAQ